MITWTVRPSTQLLVSLALAAAAVFTATVGIIHISDEYGFLIVGVVLLGFSLANLVGCIRQRRAGVGWLEPSRDLSGQRRVRR